MRCMAMYKNKIITLHDSQQISQSYQSKFRHDLANECIDWDEFSPTINHAPEDQYICFSFKDANGQFQNRRFRNIPIHTIKSEVIDCFSGFAVTDMYTSLLALQQKPWFSDKISVEMDEDSHKRVVRLLTSDMDDLLIVSSFLISLDASSATAFKTFRKWNELQKDFYKPDVIESMNAYLGQFSHTGGGNTGDLQWFNQIMQANSFDELSDIILAYQLNFEVMLHNANKFFVFTNNRKFKSQSPANQVSMLKTIQNRISRRIKLGECD